MRLPTQLLLCGAILANGARAQESAPAADTKANTPVDAPTTAAASTASAPSEPVVQLEPVRVTADIWASPLEKLPASVSVYGAETLDGGGVEHFGDLVNQIPNLTYTGGSSRPRYFQIRGIGENSQFEGETPDSSVRFLVDDLDFTGLGTVGSTFDTRQVEVLRGPQAGAFGANAAGGVVRLVTNEPTPVWTGSVQGSVGEDNLREVGVAVGGPVIAKNPEKLMLRVGVQQSESDGFRRNVFLNDDTNARDELATRLRLTWNPSAAWRWDATAFFADVDNGYDEFALDNNGRYTYSDQPGRDEQRSLAGSLRGVYSGSPDVEFTTVTTATDTDSYYSYDADWTSWRDVPPMSGTDGYSGYEQIDRDRATFGQELRLDSVPDQGGLGWIDRWTLGVYYSRLDENTRYTSDYAETGYSEQTRMRSEYIADNEALFGQIAHDFSSANRLIVGLRVEGVQQDGDIGSVTDDVFGGSSSMSYDTEFSDTLFGGKVAFEHDLDTDRMLFASVARGYRGGGLNLDRKITLGVDPLEFETETLWNYEAGLRGRWMDRRLAGGLTFFYTDRDNTQIRGSQGSGGNYRYFTDNADDSEVYGLESSAEYFLVDHFSVYGSLALMGSSFETFTYTSGGVEQGGRLPNTPDYGYTVGLRYQPPRGAFGGVEAVGRDAYRESISHNEERDAYVVANARLGYAWKDWEISLWAKNLFDQAYAQRVFYFANTPAAWNAGLAYRYESLAAPRQVGVSAAYNF